MIQTRGNLTPRIERKSKMLLGYVISTTELRLMPYIMYVMVNDQRLEPCKVNPEERQILSNWRKQGWIDGGAGGLTV
jgi:hypothetical protein